MENIIDFVAKKLDKTVRPIPTLEELALTVTNNLFNDIMSLDKYTLETLSVIHNIARENESDFVTYEELVERLPYVPEGDYPYEHLMDLDENHHLICTETYFNEDGSESMGIYIRGIDYVEK
jgi:hypothetical protein